MEFSFIHWAPDVVALHLGPLAIRWYSLCWLIGLTLAYLIVKRLYKEAGIKSEKFEPLFLYCFLGILIGARLGHCIFYEPGYFLTSARGIIEMFLPIRLQPESAPMLSAFSLLTHGHWHFIGFEGLASHGGTAGLMFTLWLYCRNWQMPKLQLLDFIAIATPVTACFIRLGNLFNSEIVGKITDVPWAFVFHNIPYHGTEPRHPGQLYEAIAYFLLFFIGWYLYRRFPRRAGTGYFFGLCLTYIFTFRFFIEYVKENQVGFENGMPFNMGQLLSVPFIIIGVYFLRRGLRHDKQSAS